MTSFVHVEYPKSHGGVDRVERAVHAAGQLRKGWTLSRGIAGMLLAAVVSALLVVADQLMETWADGHLLAAWVLLWVIGFAAVALLAPAARSASTIIPMPCACQRWIALWSAPSALPSRRHGNRCRSVIG